MGESAMDDDLLLFDDSEDVSGAEGSSERWVVLIVDDEKEIHDVTKLALGDFEYDGRTLEFVHAYTGAEASRIMRERSDVALMLLDVVMEDDHAGLRVVKDIREELDNPFVRIVLRTGQPGQAPERDVIRRYDINDYKEKTELTSKKLFTVVYTGLKSYQAITELEASRRGLENVIDGSAVVFSLGVIDDFPPVMLQQLCSKLFVSQSRDSVPGSGIVIDCVNDELPVLAAEGDFGAMIGMQAEKVVGPEVFDSIRKARQSRQSFFEDQSFVGYFETSTREKMVMYVSCDRAHAMLDQNLIKLFHRNASIAMENLGMKRELEKTQRELVIMLSEAIEWRFKETGNHVRRVCEFSKILAEAYGLPPEDVETIYVASALHDAGKIAIEDSILCKPGRHTEDESRIMRTHAQIGQMMFASQELPLLQAAAEIAGSHHEKWDGSGYPKGLAGEDIPIMGRIVALVDVFDALASKRCYKDAWPMEKVVQLIRDQSGSHFDPAVVEVFEKKLDKLLVVQDKLKDIPHTVS